MTASEVKFAYYYKPLTIPVEVRFNKFFFKCSNWSVFRPSVVQVYRNRKWIKVMSDTLIPGDIVSISKCVVCGGGCGCKCVCVYKVMCMCVCVYKVMCMCVCVGRDVYNLCRVCVCV